MDLLNPENCIKIGIFLKPHGISGRIVLHFEGEMEASLEQAKYVLVENDGLPVPWFVQPDGIRIIAQGTALVDLDWIDDDIAAKKLCGSEVYLTPDQIIQPEGQDTSPGWVGYDIISPESVFIGTITGEDNYSGNLVFTVKTPSGERLVPYHQELFIHADALQKQLTLSIAEGLLDL